MATATILQPTSHHPSAHSSAYPTTAAAISNMISSEPGKPAGVPAVLDAKDSTSRQSLPSISDVLKVAEPRQFQPPAPPSMQPTSSFPSPFTSGPRGSYSDGDKHASPQTLHPSSFPARQEPPSTYADSPRSSFHGRPGLPAVPERRPSPPLRPDIPPHHMTEAQRAHDPHHPLNNGAYAHPPPTVPPLPTGPYAHGPLPPGQVPLPGYPISPHRAGPPGPHPYDHRGPPPPHPDDVDPASRARYESARHFEQWPYPGALARVAQSARTVFNFAEAYHRIASEQSGSPPMPERLPTDHEIAEMLNTTDLVKRSLEQVRDLVHQSAQSERIRDSAKPKGPYDDDDVAMYTDHMKAPQYIAETKKRRGRAAPPGRCHSCNRIDTPEWRRGPDGARTLCNACGLHYAKLERKRQLEARQIRPKHDERP
ncbi:hypothetical protein NLU13_4519 [Sarocladium strictum]|uniref:GATA-type domain-containing protein n=1 Tax=Sarocladium strictum TaxID=5046 RepID=A0AA39GJU3_SARSR|nr:hypothetical protein NLU13_4519 [Sarocladium strictum]